MKAVVVEIRGTHAAVLSDEGCVVRVRNKNYAIGQAVELKSTFGRPSKAAALTATAAALALAFGVTAWAYCTPYSYVSLDVNPSIEYSVNRFSRVLSAKAVDEDGVKILKGLKLENKTIGEAVERTVEQIGRAGYFQADDPDGIVIATSCENKQSAKKLATDLQDKAERAVDDTAAPVEVESVSVAYERVAEAKTLGTTPGKLNLVQKLQADAKDPDSIDVQEWLKKPVKDIMKAIKTEKKTPESADASPASESRPEDTASSGAGGSKPEDGQKDSNSSAAEGKTSRPEKRTGPSFDHASSRPDWKDGKTGSEADGKPESKPESKGKNSSDPDQSEKEKNRPKNNSGKANDSKEKEGAGWTRNRGGRPSKGMGYGWGRFR